MGGALVALLVLCAGSASGAPQILAGEDSSGQIETRNAAPVSGLAQQADTTMAAMPDSLDLGPRPPRPAGLNGPAPRFGTVWSPPSDALRAAADLREMAGLGLRAVRTTADWNPDLADLADSLGIALLQEIPLYFPTGGELERDKDSWHERVREIVAAGRASGVGLAYVPHTRNPRTCDLLREAAGLLPDGVLSYITAWERPDPCAGSVDLVLYDAPSRAARIPPHESMASLGFETGSSEFEQADLLATRIPDRLNGPGWTFLYRWTAQRGVGGFEPAPFQADFGLHRPDGSSRPAVRVVEGALTRGQTVFARPAQPERESRSYFHVLAGWVVVLVLIGLTIQSPRMGTMARRYLTAHGIYLTALGEGRDQMLVGNLVLGMAMGFLAGLVGQVYLGHLLGQAPTHMLWYRASEPTRRFLDVMANSPGLVITLVMISYLLIAGYQTCVVLLVAARRRGGRLGQAMMLAVWPQWPALLTLPMVMLFSEDLGTWSLWAALVWAVALVWGSLGTLFDTTRVFRPGAGRLLVMAVLSPLSLTVLAGLGLFWMYPERMQFLLQLAL